jgi:hypothetical protein
VRGQQVGDNWVVPYNRFLLARHRSHICVEIASHLILYKYVYKYCFKPPDNGTIQLNEIATFISGRTLSSAEAVWRILELPLHKEFPTVRRLTVHLPDQHNVVYEVAAGADAARARAETSTSTLLQWFELNVRDPAARSLLYKDVPTLYRWDQKLKHWVRRKNVRPKVARMHGVSPHNVELFMLRRLLLVVPGAQSFADLRTVGTAVHPTFESAVRARGLLNTDDDIYEAFQEVVQITVNDRYINSTSANPITHTHNQPPLPFLYLRREHNALHPPPSLAHSMLNLGGTVQFVGSSCCSWCFADLHIQQSSLHDLKSHCSLLGATAEKSGRS